MITERNLTIKSSFMIQSFDCKSFSNEENIKIDRELRNKENITVTDIEKSIRKIDRDLSFEEVQSYVYSELERFIETEDGREVKDSLFSWCLSVRDLGLLEMEDVVSNDPEVTDEEVKQQTLDDLNGLCTVHKGSCYIFGMGYAQALEEAELSLSYPTEEVKRAVKNWMSKVIYMCVEKFLTPK